LESPLDVMNDDFEKTVSEALECDPELLPYLPRLLTDLWPLGSSPDVYVELLKSLDLDLPDAKVLDLGCGKGAVPVTLARSLGWAAVGVDICGPFIEEARRKAGEYGVGALCRFEIGDIRRYVQQERDFDVVVYAHLGSTLGGFGEIAACLRRCIKPRRYMLVDDGFLKEEAAVARKGYRHYRSRDETTALLTSHGDTLMGEVVIPDEDTHDLDRRYIEAMRGQAASITAEKPDLADALARYIRSQQEECVLSEESVSRAIWLLQKGDDTA
jgi:SAM-dependent methyltransferase